MLFAALRARDAQLGLNESSGTGCVVVNRAAVEFQQRVGQALDSRLTSITDVRACTLSAGQPRRHAPGARALVASRAPPMRKRSYQTRKRLGWC